MYGKVLENELRKLICMQLVKGRNYLEKPLKIWHEIRTCHLT
jgi:hypothetical protein